MTTTTNKPEAEKPCKTKCAYCGGALRQRAIDLGYETEDGERAYGHRSCHKEACR